MRKATSPPTNNLPCQPLRSYSGRFLALYTVGARALSSRYSGLASLAGALVLAALLAAICLVSAAA